ncbi:hypothetical protein sscle_07g060560 [Sclerotinia sclerotiorum 1980 UF-70]|uniref:Uncharacterized protein n=1 Tax=Sclerotinia sclerotiorum (strain ATCC 18683 / 1980 / Ss-1) TaxID=665079 RepID=A0A1D9Q8Q7_SCLS1|nr:hypothetical protein sscle_07g060560 [Sclerotinia sclerotiorum 1980 UF-70]
MPPAPSVGKDSYTRSNTSRSCDGTITISNVNERVTYGFSILLETSPGYFRISGGCQVTVVVLESLETTLAGTILLIEYDSHYRRIFTWLWHCWLRKSMSSIFQIEAEAPDLFQFRSGKVFLMSGGSPAMRVHESVLERKWSGRLYIGRWRQYRWVLIKYLWEDIRKGFDSLINCWTGH